MGQQRSQRKFIRRRIVGEDLRGSSFRGCDLRGALFIDCNLERADFRSARLGRPRFRNFLIVLSSVLVGIGFGLLYASGPRILFFLFSGYSQLFLALVSGTKELIEPEIDANFWNFSRWAVAVVSASYFFVFSYFAWATKKGVFWVRLAAVIKRLLYYALFLFALTFIGGVLIFGVMEFLGGAGFFEQSASYVLGNTFAARVAWEAAVIESTPFFEKNIFLFLGVPFAAGLLALSLFVIFNSAVALILATTFLTVSGYAFAMVGVTFMASIFGAGYGGIPVVAALSPLVLSWYIRRKALAEDTQFRTLRNWLLRFMSFGATGFRRSVLDHANFSSAECRHARFSEAVSLKYVRFNGATGLAYAELSGTLLRDRRVREVLSSGKGIAADLTGGDFRETSLVASCFENSCLRDCNFSGADCESASFENADLRGSVFLGSNLTNAKFTGSCVEGWNLDGNTRLNGASADYVYLRCVSGRQFSERRPQGGGLFGASDFETLFTKALTTVDLIFRNGVDWEAFDDAFRTLQERVVVYGDDELGEVRVQSIENTADGRVLIRVVVPSAIDKDDSYRLMMDSYEQKVMLLEKERSALISDLKVKENERLLVERELRSECKHNRSLELMLRDHIRTERQIIYNLQPMMAGELVMSNGKYVNNIGDFRGGIVNNQSELENVVQSVTEDTGVDDPDKKELGRLLVELDRLIRLLPKRDRESGEALEVLAAELVKKAASSENRVIKEKAASSLLDTAKTLSDKAGPVVQVIERICGLLGLR